MKKKPSFRFILFTLCLLIFLISTFFAFTQDPRPNPFKPVKTPSLDWFKYPLEQNAFKRLPVISVRLNDVFVLPDGKKIWAVGMSGMIVHSYDGGKSWQQQSINIEDLKIKEQPKKKAASYKLPSLISQAHAQVKGSKPPIEQSLVSVQLEACCL